MIVARANAWPWVAAAAAAAAVAVCVRGLGPLDYGVLLVLLVAAFVLPGVLAAWLTFAPGPGRTFAAATFGPVWGFGVSSLVLLALWAAGLRGAALLATPVLAIPLAAALGLLARGMIRGEPGRRRDATALFVLVFIVALLVGRPFARVAEWVPEGRAYRAYFTADMVWRMAVVAELGKGDVPPRNPFHRGDRLHYYWLAHLLPAAAYEALHDRASIEQVLLAQSLALDIVFVLFFYGFARQWIRSSAAAAAACAIALLGSSFEGLERLVHLWRVGAPYFLVETLNIDAVTRWFYDSLPVDGLQRMLWYQPQHSTGYALGLSALVVAAQTNEEDGLSPRVMALCGVLLAFCLLLSSFSAIMLTVIVCAVVVARAASARAWRRVPLAAIAGALPLGAAASMAHNLGYVDRAGRSLLTVTPNHAAFRNTAIALVLSFGPLLVGAAAGALLVWRREPRRFLAIGAVVIVSFLFYFFVDVRDHQFVYVGWRAGHLLFIAFAVLTGYAFQELARRPRGTQAASFGIAALLVLLAAPTFAIDFHNTQDIGNRADGPGFKWTLVLSRGEIAMFDWIRAETPPQAIVQVEPFSRDPGTWAYVPAFAERRMSAGIPISMVPLDKYHTASVHVRELYQHRDAQAAYDYAAHLGIDYLVIGEPERAAYPDFERVLRSDPTRFEEAFRAPDVALYRVKGGFRQQKARGR